MKPTVSELGGFETRLLAELTRTVEARAAAGPSAPARRRRRGLPLVIAGGIGLAAVATAGAAGVLPGISDPGKQAVERGPGTGATTLARAGAWTLRSSPRPGGGAELEVASAGFSYGFTVTPDGPAIQVSSGPGVLAGWVADAAVATLELGLRDGVARSVPLTRERYFLLDVPDGERAAVSRASLVARGERGGVLATVVVDAGA